MWQGSTRKKESKQSSKTAAVLALTNGSWPNCFPHIGRTHPPTNWEHAQVVLILQGRVAIKTGQSKKNSNWGIPAFRKSVQVYLKKFIWGNVGITKVDIISSLSNSELTIYHIISQTPRKFFKNSLPKKRGLSKRYVYFQITIFQGLWRAMFHFGGCIIYWWKTSRPPQQLLEGTRAYWPEWLAMVRSTMGVSMSFCEFQDT